MKHSHEEQEQREAAEVLEKSSNNDSDENVPISKYHTDGNVLHGKPHGPHIVLTADEKTTLALAEWVQDMARIGYGRSIHELRLSVHNNQVLKFIGHLSNQIAVSVYTVTQTHWVCVCFLGRGGGE